MTEGPPLQNVTIGLPLSHDTLLPMLGSDRVMGWYRDEGLDVNFRIFHSPGPEEALASNEVDVAMSGCYSVIAAHGKYPYLVYWYGLSTFDGAIAMTVRPTSGMKTVDELAIRAADRASAISAAARQLKGKTVITISNTGFEQAVASFVARGGLDFEKDIKIVNLDPDQGIAAFRSGRGDAFVGVIPQRTMLEKQGMTELAVGKDLGPPPMDGFATTSTYARDHQDVLLKILKVWFRIVNYIRNHPDEADSSMVKLMNKNSNTPIPEKEFKYYWQHYQHFPLSPAEAAQDILQPDGANYWKRRWDDCNDYLFRLKHAIPAPVDPEGVFLMKDAQAAYVRRYGESAP